jgi:hypothetical protein
MRNVAFEFNNMETDLVMHFNFLYLILVERGFELNCNSKPLHENSKIGFVEAYGFWTLDLCLLVPFM